MGLQPVLVGRKVGSLKPHPEVAAQSREEKWHAAVARSAFQVKMLKNLQCRSTFGSCDVEKWHAAVARSTFQVKMLKNDMLGTFLDLQISKNGTPLWCQAHLQDKM